jgi:hypothetical protein
LESVQGLPRTLPGDRREETKMAGNNFVMYAIKSSANYRKRPPDAKTYSDIQGILYMFWEPKFSTIFRVACHFSLP